VTILKEKHLTERSRKRSSNAGWRSGRNEIDNGRKNVPKCWSKKSDGRQKRRRGIDCDDGRKIGGERRGKKVAERGAVCRHRQHRLCVSEKGIENIAIDEAEALHVVALPLATVTWSLTAILEVLLVRVLHLPYNLEEDAVILVRRLRQLAGVVSARALLHPLSGIAVQVRSSLHQEVQEEYLDRPHLIRCVRAILARSVADHRRGHLHALALQVGVVEGTRDLRRHPVARDVVAHVHAHVHAHALRPTLRCLSAVGPAAAEAGTRRSCPNDILRMTRKNMLFELYLLFSSKYACAVLVIISRLDPENITVVLFCMCLEVLD
jgi:hypothetical protein